MDFNDLTKIDIKDLQKIDLTQVRQEIENRPNILINVVLIAITLFVIIFFWSKYGSRAKTLKTEIALLNDQLNALKEQEKSTTELQDFIKNFPKSISSEELIDLVSDFALKHKIQILSFIPAEEKNNDHWTSTSVIFNVTASNYVNLLMFIMEIENSPYALKIENWSGSYEERHLKAEHPTATFVNTAIIKIQSIRLNNG